MNISDLRRHELYLVYRALAYAELAVIKKSRRVKSGQAGLVMEAAEYRRLRELIKPEVADLIGSVRS